MKYIQFLIVTGSVCRISRQHYYCIVGVFEHRVFAGRVWYFLSFPRSKNFRFGGRHLAIRVSVEMVFIAECRRSVHCVWQLTHPEYVDIEVGISSLSLLYHMRYNYLRFGGRYPKVPPVHWHCERIATFLQCLFLSWLHIPEATTSQMMVSSIRPRDIAQTLIATKILTSEMGQSHLNVVPICLYMT